MCWHKWIKIERNPHKEYYDYSGFRVGVFRCYCTKCGKIKDRKFM